MKLIDPDPSKRYLLPVSSFHIHAYKSALFPAIVLAPILSHNIALFFLALGVFLSAANSGLLWLARKKVGYPDRGELVRFTPLWDEDVDYSSQLLMRHCLVSVLIPLWLGATGLIWFFESFFVLVVAFACLITVFNFFCDLYEAKQDL